MPQALFRMSVSPSSVPCRRYVVLNVLKEELPQERQSRFWAFALGLVVYGGLLLVQ